jgi:hypothetical protein
MRRLIANVLIVVFLIQAFPSAALAMVGCPHDAASQHPCKCCPDGLARAACIGACTAAVIPTSMTPSAASPTHDSSAPFAAAPVRGATYTPLDPPPIR